MVILLEYDLGYNSAKCTQPSVIGKMLGRGGAGRGGKGDHIGYKEDIYVVKDSVCMCDLQFLHIWYIPSAQIAPPSPPKKNSLMMNIILEIVSQSNSTKIFALFIGHGDLYFLV